MKAASDEPSVSIRSSPDLMQGPPQHGPAAEIGFRCWGSGSSRRLEWTASIVGPSIGSVCASSRPQQQTLPPPRALTGY